MSVSIQQDAYVRMFITVLFVVNLNWKKYPSAKNKQTNKRNGIVIECIQE